MKPLTCWTFAFAILTASASIGAETTFDAAARAKAVGTIVSDETAIVGHADLSRATPDVILNFLMDFAPNTLVEMRKSQKQLQGWRDTLLNMGVKEVYFTLTPTALLQGPTPYRLSWAIVFSSPEQEKVVRAALRLSGDAGKAVDGVLAIPTGSAKELRPIHRPELAAAFEAAGDTAVQLVLIPPPETRRVVDELLPQLPKQLGGGPTSTLTRGIRWAAVGIDFSPRKAFRLVIQSEDAKAAEALRGKVTDLLRLVAERPEVRKNAPKFDSVVAFLTPKVEGDRLIVRSDENTEAFGKAVDVLMQPWLAAETRMAPMNDLKQIGLAMHNYAAANKTLPPPYKADKDGKPLLSWRVLILPYIEQDALYKQFHLDEPWDSAHNRTLIEKMPSVYRLRMSKSELDRTNYLLPVGNGALFDAGKTTEFKEVTDGTSATIMVVTVDDQHAVVWTRPDDWAFDPKDPTKGLGRFFAGGFNTTFCDGSVRSFEWPQNPKDVARLRALFTRAGREVIEW